MIQDTLSRDAARRFYDRLGAGYDLFSFYEGRAKERALQLLALQPGQSVLNAGIGAGKQHVEIQQLVQPGGSAVGIDISPRMLAVARQRSQAPLAVADAGALPFPDHHFDRVYASYLLDLIPAQDIPGILAGFRRVLKPEGRMVLVSLTEGINTSSRAFVGLWKLAYAVSPLTCGGCRPLELTDMAHAAGFNLVQREVIVQLGVPSEILAASQ